MKKVLVVLALLVAGLGFAQEAVTTAATADTTVNLGLIALGAGLAIGLSAIGAAIGMAGIGRAGAGVLAERPQAFGQILIYLVLPETIVIFGFVIAFLILGTAA
ncbi:MAG: V-type ATP synthase subunit K [Deinococcota bacterium]|jgi:V/A-type H+-transporting ATPase subunit K|nr:V-type ATP synthase subunit K [Deinococcota bacterium]